MTTDDTNEKEIVEAGSSPLDVTQVVSKGGALLGLGAVRKLRTDLGRRQSISPYKRLIVRLVSELRISVPPQTYYSDVLAVVSIFSELRSESPSEADLAFNLGVLSDYCLALPADEELVDFLTSTFQKHSHLWIRLHCAQCMGHLWGGLRHAKPLFATLIGDHDKATRVKAAQVLSRVLHNRRRLMRRVQNETRVALAEFSETAEEDEKFSQELSEFSRSAPMMELLPDSERITIGKILRKDRDEEELQKSPPGGFPRLAKPPSGRQRRLRVLGEVESVTKGDVVVEVAASGVGWYSLLIPSNQFPTRPRAGQRVDVDIRYEKGKGIVDFGIPADAKIQPPVRHKKKPRSSLPREPADYNDEGQVLEYQTKLRKFFHLE